MTPEQLAEALFATAASVEQAGQVPRSHLDLLAAEGLYGLYGPEPLGGVAERAAWRIAETLASGCLATTFVWLQHHGAVRAVAGSDLRDGWLEPLCRGRVRAGLALGGLRPGPASLRVRAVPGGYVLDGEAPWVTGWGLVDVVHVAARDPDDTIVWLLMDAAPAPSLTAEPLDLVAVTASATVTLRFASHLVPAERLTGMLPYAEWPARDAAGLRLNGSLALGVAHRCRLLLAPDPVLAASVGAELDAARERLDAAGPGELPAARAAASELALRACATLVTAAGARSILAGEATQRLLREATFLLVFGSRPGIRAELLHRLTRSIMS